jgi:NRAMP (natural resistance-associated macrophage protein)-like metal ion transporter
MRPRPGLIITAAFIGPGTITTCTLAGRNLGYTLLWVLIFATFATFVLQEMSGRLSLVGGMGLGKTLHDELPGRIIPSWAMK